MLINLGKVKPGSTVYIPFHTFDSNDPSASVTITGLAVTDIEVYKDGGTTQRASDSGYTLLDTDGIDFDTITGIHGFSIDLSDNTTAGFWAAGSRYFVVVSSITVDAATINFIPVMFEIGYEGAILNTTIATLSTQTSFTLTSGPGDDDALNGCPMVVHDVASAIQMCVGYVSDYTGSTKTVTLAADPGIFTMAATDNVAIFLPANVAAVGGTAQTAGDIIGDTNDIQARLPAALVGGKMDSDVTAISGDTVAADNMEADYDGTGYNKANSTIGTTTTNTDMRGTDGAALASVLGALADAAAAGDPTSADTVMQYIKQLVNVLVGTTGVTTFPAAAAPANNVSLAEIIRAIYDDTNSLDGTKVPDTLSLANINAEVVDTLNTDTYAEPGQETPGATVSLTTKIGYLYKFLRNRVTVTSSTISVYNDDATTVGQKSTHSDDATTYDRGEFATGP